MAVFDSGGNIVTQEKIKTNPDYNVFISDVEKIVAKISTNTNIACCLATPGFVHRDTGVVDSLGNLGWENKPLRDDISKVIGNIPIIIENDARVAGLAEASLLKDQYEYVLYLTISTGIGGALLKNGEIVKDLQDSEMGQMPLFYEGKIQRWEEFASGKAILERYGKLASDIDSSQAWEEIGDRISYGLGVCCSVLQPEVIVFGGGVGQYADKFIDSAKDYLKEHLKPVVKQPKELLVAKFGADSSIHGCFTLLKQQGMIK